MIWHVTALTSGSVSWKPNGLGWNNRNRDSHGGVLTRCPLTQPCFGSCHLELVSPESPSCVELAAPVPSSLEAKLWFLNQCSESLGEYALSSNVRSLAGSQVLRIENSVQIVSLMMEHLRDSHKSVSVFSQLRHEYFGSFISSWIWWTRSLCRITMRLNSSRQDPCSFSRWKFLFSIKNCHSLQTAA